MIKIPYKKLLTLLLVLDFLINVHFLYFYTVSWSGFVKIGIYILMFLLSNLSTGITYNTANMKYIAAFLGAVLIETVYSMIHYNQGVDLLKSTMGYFVLLGVPIIYSYFKTYDCLDDILDFFVLLVLLMQVLIFIQAFLYNSGSTNVQFLNSLFGEDGEASRIRNDTIRSGQFNKYVYMIYFYCLYKFVKTIKLASPYFVCAVLTMVNELYVGQTRGSEVILIAATLLILIIGFWAEERQGLSAFIVLTIIFVVIFSNVISVFMDTFIISDVDTVSVRIEAIEYFFGLAKKTPLFGVGLIYPIEGERLDLWHTLYGPDLVHPYVYSDIGILGVMAEFGFLVIPTYIAFLYRMISVTINAFKKGDHRYLFLLGCLIYVLGTLGTLIIKTTEITLIWAVFEYVGSNDNIQNSSGRIKSENSINYIIGKRIADKKTSG